MRVLVVTTVHTPLDARIHRRQVGALKDAAVEVTYAAPWTATGTDPAEAGAGVRAVDVPRSVGRRRVKAILVVRRLIGRLAASHDLILLHDPELLLSIIGRRRLPPVVWDVHEDTAAALVDRRWVPRPLQAVGGLLVRIAERWAERRLHLILAEESYQDRFHRRHPFVPNVPLLPTDEPPPSGDGRVVYLGRIAASRGAYEVLALARSLGSRGQFHLVGAADADVSSDVERAAEAGEIYWHGFVPNKSALQLIQGASVGLSLIEPQPNHRGSLQGKVLDYLSRRVPVVVSDLPVTGAFVREHQAGFVVPYGDRERTAAAVRQILDDDDLGRAMGDRGFAVVRHGLSWDVHGPRFVDLLRGWARE